jgi:predicted nucleic-acid-binding protein
MEARPKDGCRRVIGLDTNVLLRVFVDDEPAQVAAARQLIQKAAPSGLLVSDLVLAEMVWTLSRRMKAEKGHILDVLRRLLERSEFVLEDRHGIREAMRLFAAGRVDFGDCLISVRNRRLGATETVSFDEDAIELAVFAPVPT